LPGYHNSPNRVFVSKEKRRCVVTFEEKRLGRSPECKRGSVAVDTGSSRAVQGCLREARVQSENCSVERRLDRVVVVKNMYEIPLGNGETTIPVSHQAKTAR
jgi:hypothetical protein